MLSFKRPSLPDGTVQNVSPGAVRGFRAGVYVDQDMSATFQVEGDNAVFRIVAVETDDIVFIDDPDVPHKVATLETAIRQSGPGPIAVSADQAIIVDVEFSCPADPQKSKFAATLVSSEVSIPVIATVNLGFVTGNVVTAPLDLVAGDEGNFQLELFSFLGHAVLAAVALDAGPSFSAHRSGFVTIPAAGGGTASVAMNVFCTGNTTSGTYQIGFILLAQDGSPLPRSMEFGTQVTVTARPQTGPDIFLEIVAGPRSDGRLQLFGFGGAPLLISIETEDGHWTEWRPFDVDISFGPLTDVRAVATLPNGAQQLFIRCFHVKQDTGRTLTTRRLSSDPNSAWGNWEDFGPGEMLAVGPLSDDRLQVIFGAHLTRSMLTKAADSPWSEIRPFEPALPEDFRVGPRMITPMAVAFGPRLQLWAVEEIDDSPSHLTQKILTTRQSSSNPDSEWDPWTVFPRPPLDVIRAFTVGRLFGGRLQLWAAGVSGGTRKIFTTREEKEALDSPWTDWQPFPSPTVFAGPEVDGSLAVAQLRDGRLRLWAATGDGVFSTQQFTAGPDSEWMEWSLFAPPP